MPPSGWEQVRRILAVRLDNIGDVVMLGPALRAVKAAMPDTHVTLMASPAGTQVAPLLPWVNDVFTYRAVWQDASWAFPLDPEREQDLTRMLHAGAYDAALIFTSFSQSPYPPAYACYLAGIPLRIGQSKEFGGSVVSTWVRSLPDATHQVDRNLHLVQSAGFDLAGNHLELHVPDGVQANADDLLRGIGVAPDAPFVVLAPGASCPARRYDPARFAAVAQMLAGDLPVVVVGSAKEEGIVAPLRALDHPAIRFLIGQTGVPELAAVIRRAALVVANDSGPMHFADAFRRPMVVLYSGTERESQWEPRAAPSVLLRRPTFCAPCHLFVCPYHMECLDISPGEVVAHARRLLAQPAAAEPALIAGGG